ncbi:hypothetical protein [Thiomicrospira microaerophila]|uniref:hypothetical protein n=1 Tax=Thiomicrospira microaerophila TaxID=406020 RepID=UPI0005C8D7C0|nr:hypothetical protein [Thiomicrospira microaerophila]
MMIYKSLLTGWVCLMVLALSGCIEKEEALDEDLLHPLSYDYVSGCSQASDHEGAYSFQTEYQFVDQRIYSREVVFWDNTRCVDRGDVSHYVHDDYQYHYRIQIANEPELQGLASSIWLVSQTDGLSSWSQQGYMRVYSEPNRMCFGWDEGPLNHPSQFDSRYDLWLDNDLVVKHLKTDVSDLIDVNNQQGRCLVKRLAPLR